MVTISGDGLIHEVINGLMERKDKSSIPTVGFLQRGTSDAMVKTILEEANEGFSIENALFCVGKGGSKKIDLIQMYRPSTKETFYSFLDITWGIVADIDLESEVLRFLGELRLQIWALLRAIKVRYYDAKYSIKSEDEGIID